MSLPSGGDELNITGLLGVENDGFIHGVMHRGFLVMTLEEDMNV